MKKIKFAVTLCLFNLISIYSMSQVAPFFAVHAVDSNGAPNCQQLDTAICFTIFQHSGVLDAVNNGLFLMDYNTLTFAIPDWYSDDGVAFYYWSGSGWNPCVEYCGLPPILISGDSVVYANANHNYSVIDTSGSSYYWVVTNGNVISGQGTSNLQVQWGSQGNGQITLIETSLNGCVDTLLKEVTILGNTFVYEIKTQEVNAFPNPTNNQISVEIDFYSGPIYIEIFDLQGRALLSTKNKTIDLSCFIRGPYLLKVSYGNKFKNIQVFKE